MRWFALILLAATATHAASPRFSRSCARTAQGRSDRGFPCDDGAFFEFAPASGAGMPSACSTTAPTGARGEVLSFTRTGNATCSKQGPATTGILDGDLVVMSSDVPRVSAVGSLLTFLRESARTNTCLRSEALDNAAWGTSAVGIAAPVVTANAGTAPDGAPTAERVVFPACPTLGNVSVLFQLAAAAGVNANTLFVKSNTASPQTISVCEFRSTPSAGSCLPCTAAVGSWTRCPSPMYTTSGASGLVFGCNNQVAYAGSGNTGAADILAWGAQIEVGGWASSYIPTTAAAATRNAESALSTTLSAAVGPSFALGAYMATISTSAAAATAAQLGTGAPDLAQVGRNTDTAPRYLINATLTTPAVAAMGTTLHTACLSDASGTRSAWWDGASVAAPASSMSAGGTAFSFGAVDAYTARVFVDPSPTRCP